MKTEFTLLTQVARCEECGMRLHDGDDVVTPLDASDERVWCSPNCVNGFDRAARALLEEAGT